VGGGTESRPGRAGDYVPAVFLTAFPAWRKGGGGSGPVHERTPTPASRIASTATRGDPSRPMVRQSDRSAVTANPGLAASRAGKPTQKSVARPAIFRRPVSQVRRWRTITSAGRKPGGVVPKTGDSLSMPLHDAMGAGTPTKKSVFPDAPSTLKRNTLAVGQPLVFDDAM